MERTNATLLLEAGYEEAESYVYDADKLERLLQRIEAKLKLMPVVGEGLAAVPVMVSLVRSYASGEYPDIPVGSIIAIVSALLYFLSPIDIIPDSLPGIGYLDDAAVVMACLALVQSDIDEYKAWRARNGREAGSNCI